MGYKVAQFKGHAGQTVSVERSVRNAGEFYIDADDAYLTKEQAPAVALAILEAAGWNDQPSTNIGIASDQLRMHIREQERKQAEAKEDAKLDKEAKAIYEAFAKISVFVQPQWENLEDAKHPWIAAAKKARELHKGAK